MSILCSSKQNITIYKPFTVHVALTNTVAFDFLCCIKKYINVFQSQHLMNGMALFLPGAGSLRGLDTGTVGEEGGVVGVDGV